MGKFQQQAEDFNKLQAEARRKLNMQRQECFCVIIDRFDDRYNIKSSRFECRECGSTWHDRSK